MHNSYFFEKKTASRHIINVGSTTPALLGAFILVGLTILSVAGCGGGGGGGSQAVTPPADEMIITPDDGTPSVPDHSFTPAGATPVVSGETMEGSLDSPDDVDYFRLELTEPGTILATINAEPGVEIAVVDGNGNVLATAVTASDATVGVTVSEKGTFFLRVLHEGLAEVGPKLYRVGAFVAKRIGAVINILRGIPTISLLGSVEVSLDLREYFEAPEGGMATYEVRASSGLLNLRVEQSALKISTLAPEFAGPVTVTVCAELQHLQVIRPNVLLPGSFPLFLIGQTFKSRTCLEFTVRAEQLPRQIEGTELSVSVAQGGEVTITLTDYIEDPEGGTLTFAHGSLPSGFGVTTDGATWTLATQSAVEPGEYRLPVRATAENGQSAEFEFAVTVEAAGPRQIEGTELSVSVAQGGEVTIRLTDYIEDPAGGPLTFALGSLPAGFGVNFGETPGPTWTIRTDATVEPGDYPITVTATDEDGQSEDFLFLVGHGRRGIIERVCQLATNVDCHITILATSVASTSVKARPTYSGGCSRISSQSGR